MLFLCKTFVSHWIDYKSNNRVMFTMLPTVKLIILQHKKKIIICAFYPSTHLSSVSRLFYNKNYTLKSIKANGNSCSLNSL